MTAFSRTMEGGKALGGDLQRKRKHHRAIRQRNVAARFRAGETVAEISAAMGYSTELIADDVEDLRRRGLMDG